MSRHPPGTQSIQRTILILKTVAERKEIGWRLTDLAAHCGLEKATAHRILACLAAERLLQQRPGDRRYVPGPLLFELALALPAYAAFKEAVHEELLRIANRADAIAFLHLRSGEETICVDRVGRSQVQPLTVIGTRRPMTESTAGVAMLLAMPKPAQEQLLESIQGGSRAGTERRTLVYRKILSKSRRYGFGISRGDVVPGLAAIALPVVDAMKRPFATISVMGPLTSFDEDRIQKIARMLAGEARRIEREHRALIVEIAH